MLDAETKRYIDLQIATLKKELLAAMPKPPNYVKDAGHAEEADHAITADSADFVVMIEGSTNVHIDGMSISVDVPAISELMEEGEGFVLVNGNTASISLVEGSTSVHIYGSTIAVDDPEISDLLVEGTGFVLINGNTGSISLVEGSTNVHIYGNTIAVDVSGGTGGDLEPPNYPYIPQQTLAVNQWYQTDTSGFLSGNIIVLNNASGGNSILLEISDGATSSAFLTIYTIPSDGGKQESVGFQYVIKAGVKFRLQCNPYYFDALFEFSGTLVP